MRKLLLSLITAAGAAAAVAALPASAQAWCYRWDGRCVWDWYGASYGAWAPYYGNYGYYDYAGAYGYPYYGYGYPYAYPYRYLYLYGHY